jgi:hypothetical protein
MIKHARFSKGHLDNRMIQAWIILVGRAHNRQTINYSELTRLMGGPHGRRAGQWKGLRLGHLYEYCVSRGLPLLPVIVVSKSTGLPADLAPYRPAKVDGPDPNAEREKVFNYDWFDLYPPRDTDE